MAVTDSMSGTLLGDREIKEQLAQQRAGIERDIDRAIDDFISNNNRHQATKILKAIEASGNPEEAFAAWKDYARTGDDAVLMSRIRDWKGPAHKVYGLQAAQAKFQQKQEGQDPRAPKSFAARSLRALFRTAAGRLSKAEHRGGLTHEQNSIYETFWMARWMFDGPNTDIHPLTQVLAPHCKEAAQEKLMGTYEGLRAQAGRPLVDESVIRGARGAVLEEALSRFERMAEQSYGAQAAPMKSYGFSQGQMPENVTFGVEFEGFTAFREKYPRNVFALSEVLKGAGLDAMGATTAKEEDGYASWKVTYDGSIVTPRDFTGRHRTQELVVADSYGVEVVSPVLKGAGGVSQLGKAVEAMRSAGFRSNESCGLHVHIGIADTTLAQKKNLVMALYNNQEALDALISPERRGDQNKFALSISAIDLDAVRTAQTPEELVDAINPGHRYYKYDLRGLVTPGGPPTMQYRGAGGAAYLDTTGDYTVILANFTRQALDNPDLRLNDVIGKLEQQRDGVKPAQTAQKRALAAPAL